MRRGGWGCFSLCGEERRLGLLRSVVRREGSGSFGLCGEERRLGLLRSVVRRGGWGCFGLCGEERRLGRFTERVSVVEPVVTSTDIVPSAARLTAAGVRFACKWGPWAFISAIKVSTMNGSNPCRSTFNQTESNPKY